MRPSRAVLGTIVLGAAAVLASLSQVRGVPLTPFALFLAAAILIELLEESDRERSREPLGGEGFRLAASVQLATVLVLGPWAGVLVAVAGTVAGALFRANQPRAAAFAASSSALATLVAGGAFHLAGGETGALRLLEDLVPLVALGV